MGKWTCWEKNGLVMKPRKIQIKPNIKKCKKIVENSNLLLQISITNKLGGSLATVKKIITIIWIIGQLKIQQTQVTPRA